MADTRPSLPRLVTDLPRDDELAQQNLLSAIAESLDMTNEEFRLCDSFAHMGHVSDVTSPEGTTLVSISAPNDLQKKDDMDCSTLEDFQLRIRPLSPHVANLSQAFVGNGGSNHDRSWSSSSLEADTLSSHTRRQEINSFSSSGSLTSGATTNSSDSWMKSPLISESLQEFLRSTSKVQNVCIMTPRAGPFDGQLVAVITLPGTTTPSAPSKSIIFATPSTLETCGRKINSLRTAILEWGRDSPPPVVWVILESMPVNGEGKPEKRKLQTWVQNINEDIYQQIMKLQIPQRRRRPQLPSLQSKFQSWRSSRIMPQEEMPVEKEANWIEPTEPLEEAECFSLSPMQKLFFHTTPRKSLDSNDRRICRFVYGLMLQIKGDMEVVEVHAAVEALVARHDMLRARFLETDQGWAQNILPQAHDSYRFRHHTVGTDNEVLAVVERTKAAIDLRNGPVFATELVTRSNHGLFLYMAAHQLVVDFISWRVLTNDLDELLRRGTILSEESMPFPHWIDYQTYEMSPELVESVIPFDPMPTDLGFWGLEEAPNLYADTETSTFSLKPDLSLLLNEACERVFRTDSTDLFLAALLLSFNKTFPERRAPTVWKQESGRDVAHSNINVMDTVGWFTSLCPISVELEPSIDILEIVKVIKDIRRGIPFKGVPFFASKFSLSEDASSNIPVEIVFNSIDSLKGLQRKEAILEPVPLPGQESSLITSDVGYDVGRIALFQVSMTSNDAGAHFEMIYNSHSEHLDRIKTWFQGFERLLLNAVGKLRFREPELTLSDVPLLRTSYEGLAKIRNDRLIGVNLPNIQDIETIYPVTPAQQEILIAQTRDVTNFEVNAIYGLHAADNQPIDTTQLCAAWEAIVSAQPSMRSIFVDGVSEEGLFDQVVLKKISPSMLFIESSEPDVALAKLPSLRTPTGEPRHRLSVCQAGNKTLVRIDASQAICDLPSIHNMVAELGRVYAGEWPSHNKSLHHTYLYHISSLETAYSLEVWKADLSSVKPCMFPRLTADSPPLQKSFKLGVNRDQFAHLPQQGGIEYISVLQLAWALTLQQFVGMDHVTFGYQFSGRDEALLQGLQNMIGSFATNLPCSVDISAGRTVQECLEFLSEAYENAKQHQNVTMSEIQHALNSTTDSLFNTCLFYEESQPFLFDENQSDDDEEEDYIHESVITSFRQSDCDVSLTATFMGSLRVNLGARYLSDNQAHNLISAFEQAIKTILECPTRQVSEISLFTDRDYGQIVLQNWEQSQPSEGVSACLHNLILQHAFTQPEHPAIRSWDGNFTYGQLAGYVSRLRTYLVNLGVGQGTTVPVVLEKNRWAPVIMLAVMQAGACFITLDSQDKITVESTIKELKPHLVLATETALRDLRLLVLNLVIVNDSFFATMSPQMSGLPQEATPESAACVFISPGKTKEGNSRSIFFTHASLCSVFLAQGPALNINNTSRVLQLSAFNVDIALVEVLGTMVNGGCVCIPSANERVEDMAGVIARMGVTWTYMTGVLARKIEPLTVPTLKTLCFRTRKLDEDSYKPWLGRNILLAYGAPDVCPLGISITQVKKHSDLNVISTPLVGRFWILNPEDSHKLMPIGAVGELAIDSSSITPHKFTLGQPLVAQNAQGSPSEISKSRYLKTGHRVRYLDDGKIQFISSVRDEVVIDGLVVDVTEVEKHLRRCLGQGVDVVVDEITTSDNVRVLAAFLELAGVNIDTDNLTNLEPEVKEQVFISKSVAQAALNTPEFKVPAHSVPSLFIPIQYFPISTSLKVNRRKLRRLVTVYSYEQLSNITSIPNAKDIQQATRSQKPLPLTQPEMAMRDVWAHVFSVPASQISGASNFLTLGGNRFLAAELVVLCRKTGIKVFIKDLLDGLSLTDICRMVSALERSASSVKTPTPSGFDSKFVRDIIAPKLETSWEDIFDITEASSTQIQGLEMAMRVPRADITYLILNFNGQIQHQRLENACEALASVHPVLRAVFAVHERRVFQVLNSTFKLNFQRIPCQASALESLAATIAERNRNVMFKPAEPVTKFTFLDAGHQGTLIVRLSKTLIDEASTTLLVQDLISLYEDPGRTLNKSSFFDYMRAAQAIKRKRGTEYWKDTLRGSKMTEIVSHPKPRAPTSRIGSIKEGKKISPVTACDVSVKSIIKAAWAVVLARLSGSNDIVFGEVIQAHHIRIPQDVNIASMVGPLENTIPVRVHFPALPTPPLDLLQYVQNQRYACRHYESLGILGIARKCTNWPFWTRFSTVVHHKTRLPPDGATTMNMGCTTFTYKTIDPEVRDMPDLLLTSIMESHDQVSLEIQFPEDRVSKSFAEDTLRLLVSAIDLLTCHDSITRRILPFAGDVPRLTKQIPLPAQPDETDYKISIGHLLPMDQKTILQNAIDKVWTSVLNPSSLGVPESNTYSACFWDLWGSVLPAHLLAERLNRDLPKLDITGIDQVHFSAQTVMANPSMLTQYEHVVRKLRENGSLTLPARRKTINLSPPSWSPLSPSQPASQALSWKHSIRRLRNHESRASMRSLGSKATGWMKHRVSLSWDGSLARKQNVASDVHFRDLAVRESRDLGSLGGYIGGGMDATEEVEGYELCGAEEQGGAMRGTIFESPAEVSPISPRSRNHGIGIFH